MTLHTKLSYVKSVLRILGYCCLPVNLVVAAVVLIVAEGIGIAEELPGAYKGTETE